MGNVSTWFKTAAANNTGSTPNYPVEGMAPSTVNDTMRENMAAIARWYADAQGSLITGGTGNAYTLASNNVFTALADQPVLVFRVNRANTGASTLKVDGLTAKALRIAGAAVQSGAIVANTVLLAAYNATDDAYDIIGGFGLSNGMWTGTALAVANGGTGSTTAADARTALGLGALAVLATINNGNWSGTDLAVANGGTGASTAGDARTNLGLGSLATANTINNGNWSGADLAVANGGTGASTAADARTNLGLGSIATRKLTISTSDPSGGSDGDLWFKREA